MRAADGRKVHADDAHMACANAGLAPPLIYAGEAQYGIRMLIMEYVEGFPFSLFQPSVITNLPWNYHSNVYIDIRRAINILYIASIAFLLPKRFAG
jgi:hypothetical protein